MDEGLLPMGRARVHLSADPQSAIEVGRRRSREPVVLRVDAQRAYQGGVPFWQASHMVWLSGRIPPDYLSR